MKRCLMVCLCVAILNPFLPASVFSQEKTANQKLSFKLFLSENKCQIAIWLTDDQGVFIDTIYVTRKTGQKGLGNRDGSLDDKWGGARLSTLPVWAHSRGIDHGGGNFYPPRHEPLPDAISSATPRAGEFVWTWKMNELMKPGRYDYYVEVNKSFDVNENHDYSWYRGQPSVVWRGSIVAGEKSHESEAQIVGHGHISGDDGRVDPDVTTLTTALKLIEKVTVTYQP